MSHFRSLVLPLLLLLAPPVASAARAQPSMVAANAYVASSGFASVDAAGAIIRLPILAAAVTPPEMAALLLDAREVKSVWHARTMVRIERRQIGADTLDLIEIERYNLGPAVREQTLRATGQAGGLEAFGAGPHVAWRIVTRPDSPTRNSLIAAGRREYPDYEARERDCLGGLCTSVAVLLDQRGTWRQTSARSGPPAPSPYAPIVTHTDGQVEFDDEATAHTIRALSLLGGLATGDTALVWKAPQPDQTITMLIDSNASAGDGAESTVGPTPTWIRRTAIVNPGPEIALTIYDGTVKLR